MTPPDARPSVCAVVVTYNRRALLEECLAALAAQTRAPDRVLVVDNASTDGTAEMVRAEHPGVDLLALPENVGGAGGFHAGLEAAHAGGAEWIWLMDDDTIPRPDALAELLSAAERLQGLPEPLLLSSKAVWDDGRLHPMNLPGLERDRPQLVIAAAACGVMPLRASTFVSLLVRREAVDRFGLPLAHFFIWSDDIEYTARVVHGGGGAYLVPTSVVHHKTPTPHTAVSTSGGRFYFHVRNTLLMARGKSWSFTEKLTLVWIVGQTSLEYLLRAQGRRASIGVVLRGVRDGLRLSPRSA